MLRKNMPSVIFAVALLLVLGISSACRSDLADSGRTIIEANRNAVVTVQLVIETTTSMEGESKKRQGKASATGTIIDPSGLVVTSLTSINPTDRFGEMMQDQDEKLQMSSKVVDAKMKMDDGTEVAMNVVLRDRDLDLAFLKPKKAPDKPFASVDLANSSAPKLLDELLYLARLGQVANYSLAASTDRISAVLTKPRTCYVGGMNAEAFGLPAFALDGKPVGILVLRTSPSKDQDSEDFSLLERMVPIVLPCSTVLNAAQQAKTAQPEKVESAPATPKPAPKPKPKPKS